jgi:stalled ribosome rescue protein Dom34
MSAPALTLPRQVSVNRTKFREQMREVLKQAKNNTVVVVAANDEDEEKVVVDKTYFDDVIRKMRALRETFEIAMDEQLFGQLLSAAKTLDNDLLLNRLRTMDEAFRED